VRLVLSLATCTRYESGGGLRSGYSVSSQVFAHVARSLSDRVAELCCFSLDIQVVQWIQISASIYNISKASMLQV
jgi:hypothetical protein